MSTDSESAIIGLIRALTSKDVAQQLQGFLGLVQLEQIPPSMVQILGRLSKSRNMIIRCLAYRELQRMGTQEAMEYVLDATIKDQSLSSLGGINAAKKLAKEVEMTSEMSRLFERIILTLDRPRCPGYRNTPLVSERRAA